MEATEFRVGNIIIGSQYYDTEEAKDDLGEDYSSENEFDFLRIMSIEPENPDFTYMLECMRNQKQPYPEIWNRLEGANLSATWLRIFGCEEIEPNKEYRIERFTLRHRPEYGFWNVTSENTYITKVEFVHEFQNMYGALQSTELELKDESFLSVL